MRRKARTDSNHADVVKALRAVGWWVLDLSRVGEGCPDVLAGRHGRLELIEIKDGAKPPSARKLTTDEAALHQACLKAGVTVRIVTSIEEAVRL
jgi:Holliday junction resolvase